MRLKIYLIMGKVLLVFTTFNVFFNNVKTLCVLSKIRGSLGVQHAYLYTLFCISLNYFLLL